MKEPLREHVLILIEIEVRDYVIIIVLFVFLPKMKDPSGGGQLHLQSISLCRYHLRL